MSEYKRLTGQKWTDYIDLTKEYGYSYIYKRLYELEDKIENGTLIELPCVRTINSSLGSYEAVYINERDLIQQCLVSTEEQGWIIVQKYACPKQQAESEAKLKELQEKQK